MGVFTFQKDYVEVGSGGVQIVDNQQQLVAGDTLKFKIAKETNTNNVVDGCTTYYMWLEYAIAWLYVDKCAYAGIMNFRVCNDEVDCHECADVTTTAVPFTS